MLAASTQLGCEDAAAQVAPPPPPPPHAAAISAIKARLAEREGGRGGGGGVNVALGEGLAQLTGPAGGGKTPGAASQMLLG